MSISFRSLALVTRPKDSVVIQASADVRPRVREGVVRVRIRETASSPVVRVTPNVQQLHDILPFLRPDAMSCRMLREMRTARGCIFFSFLCITAKSLFGDMKGWLSAFP